MQSYPELFPQVQTSYNKVTYEYTPSALNLMDTMPCSFVDGYACFEETFWLSHPKCWKHQFPIKHSHLTTDTWLNHILHNCFCNTVVIAVDTLILVSSTSASDSEEVTNAQIISARQP